jgi:hypothetical protein
MGARVFVENNLGEVVVDISLGKQQSGQILRQSHVIPIIHKPY